MKQHRSVSRVPARRALVLALTLALTLLLSACGASKSAQHPGTVKVYFCTTVSMPDCKSDATVAQEQAVGRALRRIPNVTKVVFVSKAAGLRRFKKQDPLGPSVKLLANPLPDEWVVTVTSERDSETVGKAICAKRYPGVQPCATLDQRGEVGGVTWRSSLFGHLR